LTRFSRANPPPGWWRAPAASCFVLVTLLGRSWEPLTGQLPDFPDALPMSYNIVHLLTAAAAPCAGFAAHPAYGQA
jgi:hypothetical protein